MLSDASHFGELADGTGLGLPSFDMVIGDIRNLQTQPRQDRGDPRVPGVTTTAERTAIRRGWNDGIRVFKQLEKAGAEPNTTETNVALGFLNRVSCSEPISIVKEGGKQYPFMARHFNNKADGTQCDLLTLLKSQFMLIVVWGALKYAQEAKSSAPVPAQRTRTQGPGAPAGVHRPRMCDA